MTCMCVKKVPVINRYYVDYGLADYGHVYGDFSHGCHVTLYTQCFYVGYCWLDALVVMVQSQYLC